LARLGGLVSIQVSCELLGDDGGVDPVYPD
jgi:hypothetical protein